MLSRNESSSSTMRTRSIPELAIPSLQENYRSRFHGDLRPDADQNALSGSYNSKSLREKTFWPALLLNLCRYHHAARIDNMKLPQKTLHKQAEILPSSHPILAGSGWFPFTSQFDTSPKKRKSRQSGTFVMKRVKGEYELTGNHLRTPRSPVCRRYQS